MTCKDCICSEVCYYKSFNDVRNLGKRRNDVEKICKSFVHRDILKNAPTVDAVEVVRCKDCKHLNLLNGKEIYAHCTKTKTVFLPFELDTRTHFCSCGERKDNGKD